MVNLSLIRSTLIANAVSIISLASLLLVPSQAAVINGNFDNDLKNWEAKGSVNLIDGQALMSAYGDDVTVVETFLELSDGTLNAVNRTSAANGSAIKQTITVNAGDILSFNWKFQGGDYLPFNDFSFYSINSIAYKLADIAQVGSFEESSSQTFHTFQTAGTYTIGFGVLNALDTSGTSFLAIDNVKVSSTTTVPEPASIIGILTISAISGTSALKRKQLVKARQN
ncbi:MULTISPECIES: PEP-CTERM sorting domain-containing protein [Nostocales]|uniref:PEP-CTERM sorting domain-containing protein n=3 Tax=Nostocales TaxID=1161 RepID=A0A8S9SYP8_9CYAN|nr:PEP-CTERM sorting domain-containing protein [Tolypothrix bouteillei]KAF3884363.1 PEP-CTERM sorting domain-containing protein [Tolypothrix bouteillei VB521301]